MATAVSKRIVSVQRRKKTLSQLSILERQPIYEAAFRVIRTPHPYMTSTMDAEPTRNSAEKPLLTAAEGTGWAGNVNLEEGEQGWAY